MVKKQHAEMSSGSQNDGGDSTTNVGDTGVPPVIPPVRDWSPWMLRLASESAVIAGFIGKRKALYERLAFVAKR